MFRSVFNIRGHSFDDDDPASCVKMAARGIHGDEMSTFLTTNIPHDDEFIPNNHLCDCDSFDKPEVSTKVVLPSGRAKCYTLSDEECIPDRSDCKCVPSSNDHKKTIRMTRSFDKIELKGNRYKIQVKTKKSKSYDSAFGTAVKKEG